MFEELLVKLDKAQWQSKAEINKTQLTALDRLVKHHLDNNPWYRNLNTDDNPLPIITKHDIQTADISFFTGPGEIVKTSGSTGQPLEVRSDNVSAMINSAYALRNLLWNFNEPNLRSSIIKPIVTKYQEYPKWGYPYELIIKTGALQGIPILTDIAEQNNILIKFQPNILLLFPNNLLALCELWRETGMPLKHLRYIRTMGETCTDTVRKLVLEVTGLKVIDSYSSQELGTIALSCPVTGLYHTMDENLIVEVLDENNNPCKEGQEGRVVVTELHNRASPLIRYAIGDYAIRGPKCSCGRGLSTLSKILGRYRNLLIHPDGSRHWPMIGFYDFADIAKVRRYQMIQHDIYNFEICIATDDKLTEEQKNKFIEVGQRYTGAEFKIKLTHYIGDIPFNRNGKFEEFISYVK